MENQNNNLSKWERIIIETDEENPTVIASIKDDYIYVKEGYTVRCTPSND